MDTLIELYVNEQFDNLSAVLTFRPRRTVFLCAGFMPERATRDGMIRFIKSVRQDASVRFIDIGNRSLPSLFKKISETAREEPDCAVDMTGGPTGALIAAHRYCQNNRVKSFFYDGRRKRFVNILGMAGEISRAKLPAFTIPQLISMCGGRVTGSGHSVKPLEKNLECAKRVLDIYCAELVPWNALSEYLQYGCKHYYDSKTQLFIGPSTLLNNSQLLYANKRIMGQLAEAGAILELATDGESVSFRFKNGFIKELLTTVGMCLELLIYLSAVECGEYDDVDMSVIFDWDGVIHGGFNDTVNEIDDVMTRGLSSTFVSCKSSRPDTRDLYEISYLASRFGGRNAQAVLATASDLSGESWANYMRARDMGVAVIERGDIEKGREHIARLLLEPVWLAERPTK